MKRTIYLMLAVITALTCAACGESEPASASSGSAFRETVDSTDPLRCASDAATTHTGLETGDFFFDYGPGLELCYVDYASGQVFPLCSKPGCTHAGPDCGFYIGDPENVGLENTVTVNENTVALALYDDEKRGSEIRLMHRNGEAPVTLAEDYGKDNGMHLLAADNTSLYYAHLEKTGESPTDSGAFPEKEFTVTLRRVPLTGGESETVCELPADVGSQLGAYGRELFFDSAWTANTESLCTIRALNVDTGELRDLISWNDGQFFLRHQYSLAGDAVYVFTVDMEKPLANPTLPLQWANAQGEKGELTIPWPEDVKAAGFDGASIEGAINGQLLLSVAGDWASGTQGTEGTNGGFDHLGEGYGARRFAYDLQTGTLRELTLSYVYDREAPIQILRQTGSELLVKFGAEHKSGQQLNKDGLPAFVEASEWQWRWGLIFGEDFLNNKANYRELTVTP